MWGWPAADARHCDGQCRKSAYRKVNQSPDPRPGLSAALTTLRDILRANSLDHVVGYILGSLMLVVVAWACRHKPQRRVDKWFRRLQLVSAALYSLGHGGNDAQKTVGIIWMLLIAAGVTAQGDPVPMWVVVLCYMAIGLGTLFGGWRIVKTMGQRLTKLKPVGGFCAETGGALTQIGRAHV